MNSRLGVVGDSVGFWSALLVGVVSVEGEPVAGVEGEPVAVVVWESSALLRAGLLINVGGVQVAVAVWDSSASADFLVDEDVTP